MIKKESVKDQPVPDLLNTTFHRTDCIFLGCVTNRFETQINLYVVGTAMHVWEMILNYPEKLGYIDEKEQGAQT